MNTDTLRNNSNAQSSNARVSSEEQGFSFRGTSRQAPAVITITFAVRWPYGVQTVPFGRRGACIIGQGSRQAQLGTHRLCGFNKEPTVYEAKEKENGEDHKFSDLMQIDRA
jgi:hypothetical protein